MDQNRCPSCLTRGPVFTTSVNVWSCLQCDSDWWFSPDDARWVIQSSDGSAEYVDLEDSDGLQT